MCNAIRFGMVAWIVAIAASANGQEVTRVSVSSNGDEANDASQFAALSSDGRFVAFASLAGNLVAGDTNGSNDVFVRDRTTGQTTRVSVDSAGNQGNDSSFFPALSADGRYVAFVSFATDLVAGDTNGRADVFVHDAVTGSTVRVSVDSSGNEANDSCVDLVSISGDGQFVSFGSRSSNLVAGDTNGWDDVFVHDVAAGTTTRASVASDGTQSDFQSFGSCLSPDGHLVAFWSSGSTLVSGDTNGCPDVFVRDLVAGTTVRVSVDSNGAQADGSSDTSTRMFSADGHQVAFASGATNLVSGDTNFTTDVFVHDLVTGATERVSLANDGTESHDRSFGASISADGNVVAFYSDADNLVSGDDNGVGDVFVRDRAAGTTQLTTLSCAGNPGNLGSSGPAISADGSLVAFESQADTLVSGDTNGVSDVFVADRTVAADPAYWNNYGTGHAGSFGIPSFTLSGDPEFAASISLDATNSRGTWSVGFVVAGVSQVSVPFKGGTLLASPNLILVEPLFPWGWSLPITVPRDDTLCGVSAFLQIIEIDPGASHGVSMSEGVEMHFGH
jgi:hypothetical protein